MDLGTVALLAGAGLVGGAANAVAGGATLITFPAMLAAGLPPLVANASNAVAVTPGQLVAVLADRGRLPPLDRSLARAVLAALVGGAAGAGLLLVTPERVFALLVPALIGAATLAYALGPPIQRRLAAAGVDGRARAPLLALTAVYGGYFGAGLGVTLLAALAVTGREEPREANAVKNLLASAVSATTLVIFVARGLVSPPETVVMLAGAVVGGLLGARALTFLPPRAVRALVVTIGGASAVVYALRYWT